MPFDAQPTPGETLSVGSSYRSGLLFVPMLAAILFLGISAVQMSEGAPGGWILATGVVFGVLSFLAHTWISLHRLWIRFIPEGFALKSWRGERVFTNVEVRWLGVQVRRIQERGVVVRLRHEVAVGVGEERFRMAHAVAVDKTRDPFGDWLQGIVERLVVEARQAQALDGDGWSLTGDGLRVGDVMISRADISAVAIFDDALCVWKRGDEIPSARIPAGSRNAFVLRRILDEAIASAGAPAETTGLGRLLFERKAPRWQCFLAGHVAVGLALGAFKGVTVAMFCVPLALLAGLLAWAFHRHTFRCHERGLYQRTMLGQRQMLFTDVGSFLYGATRMFVHGAYAGTTLQLVFVSLDGKQKLKYGGSVQGQDEAIDRMRDVVSSGIAARMAAELGAGRPVPWTRQLRLLPEGIEYRARGFFRDQAPVVCPFDRVTGFDIQEGYFYLWVDGGKKPVVQVASSEMNFFPGYALLIRLFQTRK